MESTLQSCSHQLSVGKAIIICWNYSKNLAQQSVHSVKTTRSWSKRMKKGVQQKLAYRAYNLIPKIMFFNKKQQGFQSSLLLQQKSSRGKQIFCYWSVHNHDVNISSIVVKEYKKQVGAISPIIERNQLFLITEICW